MKALLAIILAAGLSLATLSSAQAITAAPLAEAAKETSSLVEVQKNQAGGCERGYVMGSSGCQPVSWNYKKSKKKKRAKK